MKFIVFKKIYIFLLLGLYFQEIILGFLDKSNWAQEIILDLNWEKNSNMFEFYIDFESWTGDKFVDADREMLVYNYDFTKKYTQDDYNTVISIDSTAELPIFKIKYKKREFLLNIVKPGRYSIFSTNYPEMLLASVITSELEDMRAWTLTALKPKPLLKIS